MDCTASALEFDTGPYEPVTPAQAAIDARELRNALGRFTTGVTVVTARTAEGASAGVTVNSFCSVSLDPPLVLWCLGKSAPSCRVFLNATHFAIHVLAEDQAHLSARFSRPAADKFAGLDLTYGIGGVPLLDWAVAVFQCRREQRHDAGDHHLLIGRVEHYAHAHRSPLVFHTGAYCKLG